MILAVGQEVEITIVGLGVAGEGVGDYEGCKVFVQGALVQERVKTRLTQVKAKYAIGKLLKIISRSPDRIDPICPLFSTCGGCQIMHVDYPKQLEIKRQRIFDALTRIGKQAHIDVPPVQASPRPLHYRNKIQMPIASGGVGIQIGLYKRGSHQVVDVEKCWIHHVLGDGVFQRIASLIKASSLSVYDERTKQGELRHLLLRTSEAKQEVFVLIITAKGPSEGVQKLSQQIARIPGVRGVVHHKNARVDNVILDRGFTTLYGDPYIEDTICGLTFKISAASFFQVNLLQAENLYKEALQWAELTPKSVVVDAYCGIGTLSLLLATQAARVIGIECVPQAIHDAKENALRNRMGNAQFICGLSEEVIDSLGAFDVLVLNPPRQGCAMSLLEGLGKTACKRIIYISCDPATLARDILILHSQGFLCERVCGFDMFPQTMHVETLALLTRR